MDVLGIISDGFNIYFPMLILAFCTATWFSLGSRILNGLGFQQFMVNETIASELVQEGKDLILREKRKRQRAENTMSRRRELANRDNTNTSAIASSFSYKTPNEGLLRDGSGNNLDYNTGSNSNNDRRLAQEINERFGISTNVGVGFRPSYNNTHEDDEEDSVNRARPKNIFDDV